MLKNCGLQASKAWATVTKRIDGTLMKFTTRDVTEDRYDDFIDFFMKYYIAREFQHSISGLQNNPEGMAEYKEILSNTLRRPGYKVSVVYRDEDSDPRPEIVSAGAICLRTLDNPTDDMFNIKPQTKALQRHFQIAQKWEGVYPIHKLMQRYGVERYFDDRGGAMHTKYGRVGLSKMILGTRQLICKEHGVPMTGAWMTSLGSEKSAMSLGWTTAFEITSKQMEQVVGATFNNELTSFKYMVYNIDEE